MQKGFLHKFFPTKAEEQAGRGSSTRENYIKVEAEDGRKLVICNFCKRLVGSSNSTRTELQNHSGSCEKERLEAKIVYRFDGEWTNSNGNFKYKGGASRIMSFSKRITYTELMDKLYENLDVNPKRHDIKVEYLYDANGRNLPIEIRDIGDLKFYLARRNSLADPESGFMRHPLFVTLINRSR